MKRFKCHKQFMEGEDQSWTWTWGLMGISDLQRSESSTVPGVTARRNPSAIRKSKQGLSGVLSCNVVEKIHREKLVRKRET